MAHETTEKHEWKPVPTPFDVDLYDVVQTAEGPFAVGASGTVAGKHDGGWHVLVEDGPAAQNSTLKSVAVTDSGKRIWFVGASGAIGAYDVDRQRKYNFSYTGDVTNSWGDVAVTGSAGSEMLLLANTGGAVLPARVDGTEVTWGEPAKPGGGSTITAVDFAVDEVAFAVDSSGSAYRAEGENAWETVGIADASVTFHDIYAGPNGRVYVAAGDGRLYRFDASAGRWTPVGVAKTALRSVDVFNEHVYVLADSNTVYWRTLTGATRWQQTELPTGSDLLALALGYPDVAVGKAGTVVKRPPGEPPEPEQPEEEPKEEPGEPGEPGVWEPTQPKLPCKVLLTELLTRLSTEELMALVERREGCGTALLEQIEAIREERAAGEESVVVLPMAEDAFRYETGSRERVGGRRGGGRREGGRRERRATGGCACGGEVEATEMEALEVLERICGR